MSFLQNVLRKFKLDPVHQSLGLDGFSPEQKHKAVHQLYRATAERDTHRTQRDNAQVTNQRKRSRGSENSAAASSSSTTPKSKA